MKKFFKALPLAVSFSLVAVPAFADDALLAALQEAGIPLTDELAAQVKAAQGDAIADAVAAVVVSLDMDSVLIEQTITAAVTSSPEQAVNIVTAVISQVPSAAAVVAGAAAGAAPDQAPAIASAAVSLAPTMAMAIASSASAAAPTQAAAISDAVARALPESPPDEGGTGSPSPS